MFTAKPNLPEKPVSYRHSGYKRAFLLQISKKNLKIGLLRRYFTNWVILLTCVIVMIRRASCITAAVLKMWIGNQINSVDTVRYFWRMNWKNCRSNLKKVFWLNLCVGPSFQLLGILEVCVSKIPSTGGAGWNSTPRSCPAHLRREILNQNPIFEMVSSQIKIRFWIDNYTNKKLRRLEGQKVNFLLTFSPSDFLSLAPFPFPLFP